MSDTELKPCPFCGGSNLKTEDWCSADYAVFTSVECVDCYIKVNKLEKWNTRALNGVTISRECAGYFYALHKTEGAQVGSHGSYVHELQQAIGGGK